MKKRIWALVLCLCLLASALPVHAAPETEGGQICQDIIEDYETILRSTNMASLQGYCGLMASWQLYCLGVNDCVWSHHGKDQFDAYCQINVTSGGHPVNTYSYVDYGLESALNAITKGGTLDVYNLLVGFERTNTTLGSVYGHSLVIYAILDGIVYFTEGYNTDFGPAGTPYQVTIAEFADYYVDWTVFEGVVVFGQKGYAANCDDYPTNLFVEAARATPLYTQPCLPGTKDAESEFMRTIGYGERLWVNGLYENLDGEFYYQIYEDGVVGYVLAEDTTPFRFNYDDVGVSNLKVPAEIEVDGQYYLSGRITLKYNTMGAVGMTVTDEAGNVIISHTLAKSSGIYDLERDTFSAMVDLGSLEEGNYTFSIQAEGINYYLQEGRIQTHSKSIQLINSQLRVGDVPAAEQVQTEKEKQVKDGWLYERGTWYYYENGAPRTGWYCYHGGDYYLKADGSVTTGWAQINGKYRYFSETGSMRTGWIETDSGTLYLMSNGAPATGSRIIDGITYFFDENGILQ